MINYKELRVGNWVIESKRRDGVWSNELDIQVKNISPKGHNIASEEYPIYYEWQWFEPISLTAEILEKCGFEFGIKLQDFVKGIHQFVEIKNMIDGYFSEDGFFYYGVRTKIQYLHQLQNLYFTLTGEELQYTPCK